VLATYHNKQKEFSFKVQKTQLSTGFCE